MRAAQLGVTSSVFAYLPSSAWMPVIQKRAYERWRLWKLQKATHFLAPRFAGSKVSCCSGVRTDRQMPRRDFVPRSNSPIAAQRNHWSCAQAISLARLWGRQGRKEEGWQLLADIYGWFTEGLETRDLVAAKALLAEL